MKEVSEIRKVKVTHPTLGELEKSVKFTYDSDKYDTLDEAIEDGEKCEKEKETYCKEVIEQNKAAKEIHDAEYQEELNAWMAKKPIEPTFTPMQPDLSMFAGRGILQKENVVVEENKKGAALQALMSATPEEVAQIKQFLGL